MNKTMRDRNIIEREAKGFDPRLMPRPLIPGELELEVLLDIRDLLAQKQKRKTLTTEVTLTQAEQVLLDSLDHHGE